MVSLTGSKLYLPWVGVRLQLSTDLCIAISIFTWFFSRELEAIEQFSVEKYLLHCPTHGLFGSDSDVKSSLGASQPGEGVPHIDWDCNLHKAR